SIARSLVVRRAFSRRELFLGASTKLVTTLEYSGRKTRKVRLYQPLDVSLKMVKPLPEEVFLTKGETVFIDLDLKPIRSGELPVEPMDLPLSSAFFKDVIRIGRRDSIKVHVGVGSVETRSLSSGKQYSDFLLSKLAQNRGGTDFSIIRNYLPGDPVEHIDWSRSSRAGALVIREYEEDQSLPVFFLIDVDSSMSTGGLASEFNSAVNLAALLINRLTTDSNMFGLTCFSREDVVKYQPLGIGREHLSKVRDVLTRLEPGKAAPPAIHNELSLAEASSVRSGLKSSYGLEGLGTVLDETIRGHSANVRSDGFQKAMAKASRSINTPCQIVVLTNLSMGLASLQNGIRLAKYYGHSVSVVLTPHIWYTDKELIDAETCYEQYRRVKDTIARIRGSGSIKVIDLASADRLEDAIYRSSTYRQSTGLRRW
ncbi:MAG: DUF58 domain-containing protein, partial [Methanocella sp.]